MKVNKGGVTPDNSEKRIRVLEEQGVLKRATGQSIPCGAPVAIKGHTIAETVAEDRKERF